ncbi:aspartate/tyrosine/aromatic aminotransferase [Arachnia propionica]|uniref:Aminotransferase n=1 Tax=Arachnia propionica TaxID=1750 RepID=A0A3P1T655_9ACTN|nr:amino acid aminotransferase [Arachnia propionica]MDO5083473.1 amino acid aminotransferase [Arachnia propionica]RRD04912.1 aspartate/tyrosine/aromatic aminotransferase [Arachnia propionica]
MSLFSRVELAPADPILGLGEAYNRDARPEKVNLGIGVYLDEAGGLPLLECVARAEEKLVAARRPHAYLPIDGLPGYVSAVRELVFGADSPAVTEGRVVTTQSLGGTGALKTGADFIKTLTPQARVLISDPSWENHRAIFARAGFTVGTYRYYDADAHGIDVDGLIADLEAAAPGTVVVLHACCHNPTGYDLSHDQWTRVIETITAGDLIPFLDMAYQGFGDGVAEDGAVIGRFVATGRPMFVSTSFSKSFSLYGERIGALHVVTADADEAKRVLSQIKICIRTTYSNPPTLGAAVVAEVLGSADGRALWERELGHMRTRIKQLRGQLVERLHEAGIADMDFIAHQVGMFSYSGLTREQMVRLREEHAIYGTDAGRMCMAALGDQNLPRVAAAIAAVRS